MSSLQEKASRKAAEHEMRAEEKIVLVVDDDRAVRESLKFALELEGLVVGACDGGPALLCHPDLAKAVCLVLDHKMPAMDGLAVMGELAARGITIPTILITAPVTEPLRQRAQKAGAFAVLEKPLLDNVLIQNVRRATVH